MAQFTDPMALYKAQKVRFAKQMLTARAAHEEVVIAGLHDMVELASGRLTKSQTRGAFARGSSPATSTPTGRRRQLTKAQLRRRAIKGGVPLLPINVQKGNLRKAIRKIQTAAPPGGQAYDVGPQGVPYAKYVLGLGGTRKAVARGYFPEVRKRWRARNKAFVDHYASKNRSS